MKFGLRRTLLTILLTVCFAIAAQAYGPLGHEIVGAIADERLANTPTAAKIRALLDGFTLEKAAVIADEIKGWDKNGVDDPRSFHYSAHRNIDSQLRDFWRANQPTPGVNPGAPSHHWFHYTDVPVVPAANIPGRVRRPQQMGRRSHDSILRPSPAGDECLNKMSANHQTRSTHFACSLRCRHSSAAACRRGIFRSAGANRRSRQR